MKASTLLELLLPEVAPAVIVLIKLLGDRELTMPEVQTILEVNRVQRRAVQSRIHDRIAAQEDTHTAGE